jgi:hypothetical protein
MDFEPEQLVALTDHGTMTLRFVAKDSQNCGEPLSNGKSRPKAASRFSNLGSLDQTAINEPGFALRR